MSAQMPAHAPYDDVVVGDEIEIRVYPREEDGWIVAECEYRDDTFGGVLDPSGLDNLALTLQVDQLVGGIAALAYHELYGTPVFREEDEAFVGRVDAQRPWEGMNRKPERGWVGSIANPEALAGPPRDLPDAGERTREGSVGSHLGDADVSDLSLSQEEMAALVRGEIPDALVEKLLAARSTENLLDSVAEALEASAGANADLDRARRELREVRRRFGRDDRP